jgi:hypothetical protein
MSDRISHILELVGPALLLPWPARSKGGPQKWKDLQLSDMDESTHLARLAKAGNIGIALGRVSNGLLTIDLDEDSYVTALLKENPLLDNTLRTRAARGCNIWLRCSSGYPPSQKLKEASGAEIGEWRADGNQTIIVGTHPSGCAYCFVVEKPVILIDYNAIIWPNCILPPHATESKRVRGVRGVERVEREREKEVVCVGGGCHQIQTFLSGNDLIAQVAPTDYQQNNRSLFKLARLAKGYEHAIGRPATQSELEFVFDRWCLVARRFWRHSRDDYYAEFLEAYSYARMGLEENPLEIALFRAKSAPLPQLQGFTDERIRLLAAICRELQELTGNNPFFLPTRKLGEMLGVHWTLAGRCLRALEVLEVIHLAPGELRRCGGTRSPRYYYGAGAQKTDAVIVTPMLLPSESALLKNGDQPSQLTS